ncbi:MAG: hypothetical protein KF760_22690 [Candidatus Eremiobacteraeota bacterium]|nr:hypothetical protein [Candidatus Eremiobacteraeota bacterium]
MLVRCLHLKELFWRAQWLDIDRLSGYRGGRDPEHWSSRGQQPVEDGQQIVLDLEPVVGGEAGYLALQLGDGKEWLHRLWLDLTGVALVQFRTPSRIRVWAVELKQGFPVSELHSLPASDDGGRSFAKGIALRVPHQDRMLDLVVAERPPHVSIKGFWHVCRDRGLYEAGETAALGGWLRTRRDPAGPLVQPGCAFLEYSSAALGSGRCPLSPLGGFLLHVSIPADCPNGEHELNLSGIHRDGERFEWRGCVQVGVRKYSQPADFEFVVQPGPGPYEYTACARLLTGQAVVDDIRWEVEFHPVAPQPPFADGFSFGVAAGNGGNSPSAPSRLALRSRTDESGRHTVKLENVPTSGGAGRVTAVLGHPLGQRWSAEQRFQASGCSLMVGLRGQGEEVEVIVCNREGIVQAGHEVHLSPGSITCLSGDRPVKVPVSVVGGWLSARVRDAEGLGSVTVIPWPATPPTLIPTASVRMWTEKPAYRPGETVRLWVQMPEPGGVGLLHALEYESRVLLQQPISETLTLWEFEVDAAMLGGVGLRLDVLSTRGHEWLETELVVPYQEQRLDLDLEPLGESFVPGQPAEVRVRVRNAQGRPASEAEVLLLVLEEDAERIGGSRMGDPLPDFYRRQPACLTVSSRADLLPASQLAPSPGRPPESPPGSAIRYDELRFAEPRRSRPFRRRSEKPLACWCRLECDGQGQAVARFLLPDQPAVYQMRALAAWRDDCFGKGSAKLAALARNLTMRAHAPAFVRPGDEVTVKIQLEKAGAEPLPVHVYARVLGGELLGTGGWSILVDEPLQLDVKIRVGEPGTLVLQLATQSSAGHENLQTTIPVRPIELRRDSFSSGMLTGALRLRQSTHGPLQLVCFTENPMAQLDDFLGSLEAPLGWAQTILLALRYPDRVEDLREAGRRIGRRFCLLDPQHLRQLVEKLLARQLPNGAFPAWETGQHPAPQGVQELIRLALQGIGQQDALRRLEAYLAQAPLPRAPFDHHVFEQAQGWFQESTRPASFDAFDCWLTPCHGGRLRPGQGRFDRIGFTLKRLHQSHPLLAQRLQRAEKRADFFRLWGSQIPPCVEPRGIVRVGSGNQCEGELAVSGWLNEPLRLSWQPSAPDFWIEWRGQGQLSYTLQQLVPAGLGNLRIRRRLRWAKRESDGCWRVSSGQTFGIELECDTFGVQYSPYPSGCTPIGLCHHNQQDLGGLIRGHRAEAELRAGAPGLYHLPPAWIECGDSYGQTDSDLIEIYETPR